jgi:hypothetical protein
MSPGLSTAQLVALSPVRFTVDDLPGAKLGQNTGRQSVLDANAAGWFMDPTRLEDNEFQLTEIDRVSAAAARMDLLTAVMHELGFSLDLLDDDLTNDLMAGHLRLGLRRS